MLNSKFTTELFLGVAMATMVPGFAFAQDAAPAAGDVAADEGGDEIVVTGTLIRGVAPGGSQSIAVTQEQFKATGASNTSQLLASVPQSGIFLNAPVASSRLSVNRPVLRNLGNTSSGSSSTLVLLDGHRLPGMGVRQVSPDVDAIAPGAIERVEIVTDGGSSLYGSDAVGGVMNFISRKNFDGVEVKGHYGFGHGYDTWDASLTAGKTWDWGSAYVSYSYAQTNVDGARDYIRNIDWVFGDAFSITCEPGNIVLSGVTYALPTLTAGRGNRCDLSGFTASEQRRHSVFAGLTFDNGSPLSVSVKGYYFNRSVDSRGGPVAAQLAVNSTLNGLFGSVAGNPNPAYTPIGGSTGPETYQITLQKALGDYSPGTIDSESWGFTVAPKWRIGGDWQLNGFFNYGVGVSSYSSRFLNSTLLGQYANAGLFLPANVGAASNATAINASMDWYDYGYARDSITNGRLVVDGPLFSLPGGDVRVAFGGEILRENYSALIRLGATAATLAGLPKVSASRTIKSVFGEVNVPLISDSMDSFIHSLSLSASGRYDHYSDLGGTFNPKFGINLAPVSWLKLRANWGKSYQAPSLADGSLLTPNSFSNLGSVRFNYGPAANAGQTEIFMAGVVDPLKPQTATTYSFGFDAQPTEEFGFGLTYYHVKFKDQIAVTPVFLSNATQLFPSLVMVNPLNLTNPTQAQIDAFNNLYNQLVALSANPTVLTSVPIANVYAIADGRTRNLSTVDVQGLDFNLNVKAPTKFGDIFLSAAGNYILSFKTEQYAGAAIQDTTKNESRFRVATTLGTHIGNFMGQIRWSHQGGFNVTPSAANLQQSRVGTFDVFDLYMQYEFKEEGALKDLTVSLNVDNMFNQAPPLYRGNLGINPSGPGYANGFTYGRVFKFGIEKRF